MIEKTIWEQGRAKGQIEERKEFERKVKLEIDRAERYGFGRFPEEYFFLAMKRLQAVKKWVKGRWTKKMIGEFKISKSSKLVGRKVKDVCKEFGVTLLHYGKQPSGMKKVNEKNEKGCN